MNPFRTKNNGNIASLLLVLIIATNLFLGATAISETTELVGGAELWLDITSPQLSHVDNSTSNTLVAGTPVTVHGTASIGKGVPDVAYIYIVDTSGSTGDPDGPCGTVLECIQEFFRDFHDETLRDRSAELTAIISFDDYARFTTYDVNGTGGFVDPTNIWRMAAAIDSLYSGGDTYCTEALSLAASLANDTSNTAGTTIVVFLSDGLCSEDIYSVEQAADTLGSTGAIVHTVAIGDEVDCGFAQGSTNNMNDIPQNGGNCTSVPDPHTLPRIIDELIGADLVSLEMKIESDSFLPPNSTQDSLLPPNSTAGPLNPGDNIFLPSTNRDLSSSNYTDLVNTSTITSWVSSDLPLEAPANVAFDVQLLELAVGTHQICFRAAGSDALGDWDSVESCLSFHISEVPTASPTDPPSSSPTIAPSPTPTSSTTQNPTAAPSLETNHDDDCEKKLPSGIPIFLVSVYLIVVIIGLLAVGKVSQMFLYDHPSQKEQQEKRETPIKKGKKGVEDNDDDLEFAEPKTDMD